MMGGYGYGFGVMGLGMLLGVLLLVGLLALAFVAISRLVMRPQTMAASEDAALATLKRRYASGEISQAEFVQARQDLEQ